MKIEIYERARRYISSIHSTAGADGSTQALRAAQHLVRGFAIPLADAKSILAIWNENNATPPWHDRDLDRKLRDALEKGQMPMGAHLKDHEARQWLNSAPNSHPAAVPRQPSSPRPYTEEELAQKARNREQWPTFKRPTDGQLMAVAKLRKLPVEAVDMARAAGFLWSATVDGDACFVISEGPHFAQVRRYDGMPFAMPGEPTKKSLPGSLSKGFVGWTTLGDPACPVFMVEGVVGLLEGIAALRAVNADARPAAGWTILAAVSCYSRFANETFPMPDLAGRRFRILPDHDKKEAGFKAAAAWETELEAMGATADSRGLPPDRPPGCKDLGPVVANTESHLDYLTKLFAI